MNREIELKLSIPANALPALRRHRLIAGAARAEPTATLTNTYFDTPDQALAAAKVALRTRKQGRRWVQTVKAESRSVGGLSSRPEWEQPYLGAFDFGAITDPPTRELLERHAESLVPLFSTDFRRETRRIEPREGSSVLVMIDKGKITANGREEAICEVELELEKGSPDDLFALALELSENLPLCPANESKGSRGLRLFRNEAITPRKAGPSPLAESDSPLAAFAHIAHDCLEQWQTNAAGAAIDNAPEFVHQMRVSLRRLRSALKLFAPALPADWATRWSDEFANAADELGEARDIDVLHEELLAPILDDEKCPANVRSLAEKVIVARNTAREHVKVTVAGASQGRRMLAFAAELGRLEGNALDASADLRVFAGLQLSRLQKQTRKRWKKASKGCIVALHSLRISLKRLRYAIEFFAPLYAPRRVDAFIAAMARAQDHLGYLNDIEVGSARLAQWAGNNAELRSAAAFITGWHSALGARVRRRIVPEVKVLLSGRLPWQKNARKNPSMS